MFIVKKRKTDTNSDNLLLDKNLDDSVDFAQNLKISSIHLTLSWQRKFNFYRDSKVAHSSLVSARYFKQFKPIAKDKFNDDLRRYYSIDYFDWSNPYKYYTENISDKNMLIHVPLAFAPHSFNWAFYFNSNQQQDITQLRAFILSWYDYILKDFSPNRWANAFSIYKASIRTMHLINLIPILKQNINTEYDRKLSDILHYHITYIKFFAKHTHALTEYEKTYLQIARIYISFVENKCQKVEKEFKKLESHLNNIIEKDGFIKNFSVYSQINLLLQLYILIDVFNANNKNYPAFLRFTLDQMSSCLRFMLANNQQVIARENDYATMPIKFIQFILKEIDMGGESHRQLLYSGFEKLKTKNLEMHINLGLKPKIYSKKSLLSSAFGGVNLFLRNQPVIIQTALPPQFLPQKYCDYYSATSTYSTLIMNNENPEYEETSPLKKYQVTKEGILFETEYAGYKNKFNILRKNNIFINAEGNHIRVEENLLYLKDNIQQQEINNQSKHQFHLRLHFHPSIKISLIEKEGHAIVKIPHNGVWHFISDENNLDIQNTIYWGNGVRESSKQLVLSNQFDILDGQKQIKWALFYDSSMN